MTTKKTIGRPKGSNRYSTSKTRSARLIPVHDDFVARYIEKNRLSEADALREIIASGIEAIEMEERR